MFKPIPSACLLRTLRASIEDRRLICSFCSKQKIPRARRKAFSTQIAPVTAVDVPTVIPDGFKGLHEALIAFGRSTSIYTNTTQLQLALKSLETKNNTTRIAILGINDRVGPVQLVQSLLVDPLSPEAPWEKELSQIQYDTKPLLIRAGSKLSIDQSHPLLRTLTIPSTLLGKHKVEIFLNHIVAEPEVSLVPNTAALSELVVPNLQARESYSGRTSSVIFPVHKTILLEDGLQTVLSIASLLQSTSNRGISKMIRIAANVDWETLPSQEAGITFVNLFKGQHSIRTLRDSLQNAITYEREWLSSGLPSLMAMILPDIPDSEVLKPTTRDLIDHILDEAELAIQASEAETTAKYSSLDLPESLKTTLKLAISEWAEQAHTELRAEMANILESRIWRKLAWWKLFWRIDDVQTVISDAIRRAYLIEAEKSSIYLAGRFAQAGLDPTSKNSLVSNTPNLLVTENQPTTAPLEQHTSFVEDESSGLPVFRRPDLTDSKSPWPSLINTSRLSIIQEKLPPLVSAAQGYVLSALSLTGLTSLTSAIAYFSITTTTLYEAGSIAAVGLVLSAYRLQSKWDSARQIWIRDVHIEGKRALDAVEQSFSTAISQHNRSTRDEEDLRTEEEARRAIEEVRRVLDSIDKPPQEQ